MHDSTEELNSCWLHCNTVIPMINYLYFDSLWSPHQDQSLWQRKCWEVSAPARVQSKEQNSQKEAKDIFMLLVGFSKWRRKARAKGYRGCRGYPMEYPVPQDMGFYTLYILGGVLGQTASVGEMGMELSHPCNLGLAVIPRAVGGIGSSLFYASWFGNCLNHQVWRARVIGVSSCRYAFLGESL